MKDRVPLKPGRVKITPEGGGAAYYATMERADQPTQEGDPLNKATLLADATAALFGLGTDAVPDDVLQKLAGAAFDSGGTITDVNGNPLGVQIATGSYVGTGKYGSSNPNSLTADFKPKMVVVSGDLRGGLVWIYDSDKGLIESYTGKSVNLEWLSNGLKWYSEEGSGYQLNNSGITYRYIMLG